jgi:uncharacterized protein
MNNPNPYHPRTACLALTLALAGLLLTPHPTHAQDNPDADTPRVLFLTHSAGFTHSVVRRPNADTPALAERQLIQTADGQLRVTATQNCDDINADNLKNYQAVVFYTTGNLPIPESGRQALLEFIRDGGGFVGVHPATDTFYEWEEYGQMIGAYFDGHPWHEAITVNVEDPTHPAAQHLGDSFEITDEIYQFRNPYSRDNLHVLLSMDTDSVDASRGKRQEDNDYALAWTRGYGTGRVFYTALGHREQVWQDERFLTHLIEGIKWAAGAPATGAQPPEDATTLFDGSNLDAWAQANGSDPRWKITGDTLEVAPRTGDLRTRQAFADAEIYLEFRLPDLPDNVRGQARSNSGVYIMNSYEVQVLDSFGIENPGSGDCGGIYSVKPPDVNASAPPETWQSYRILFRAPRWDDDGNKTENARITVIHNGILIHRDVEIPRQTGGGQAESPDPRPLRLQDHGNTLHYRNIWIRPLNDNTENTETD